MGLGVVVGLVRRVKGTGDGRGHTFVIVDGSCALFVLPPCVFLCFAVGRVGLDAIVVVEYSEGKVRCQAPKQGATAYPTESTFFAFSCPMMN